MTSPEFCRTQDVYKLFGLKRGSLYSLLNQGKVKAKLKRIRGNITGIRLWDVDSIRQYIQSNDDGAARA